MSNGKQLSFEILLLVSPELSKVPKYRNLQSREKIVE